MFISNEQLLLFESELNSGSDIALQNVRRLTSLCQL